MGTMICSSCNQAGIYWKGLAGLSPWTFCPHCMGPRDPIPEEPAEEEEEDD